jgi:hypothetical protein
VHALDTNGGVLTATRDVYLLTQTCNILVGSTRYRVASHDKIYLAPHTVRQGERVTLEGLCSGSASVQSVEFHLGGVLQATDAGAPYLWTLNTTGLAVGTHTVAIKARLAGGAESNHAETIEIVAP